jgi:hypothetical protein
VKLLTLPAAKEQSSSNIFVLSHYSEFTIFKMHKHESRVCYTSIIYWLFHLTSDKYLGLTALTKLKKTKIHFTSINIQQPGVEGWKSWAAGLAEFLHRPLKTDLVILILQFCILRTTWVLDFPRIANTMTHFWLNIFTKMRISLFSSPPYSLSFIWILVLLRFSHHLSKFWDLELSKMFFSFHWTLCCLWWARVLFWTYRDSFCIYGDVLVFGFCWPQILVTR